MGYEYKIVKALTLFQVHEICQILESSELFSNKYKYNNAEFREFRSKNNNGKIPDFYVIVDESGVYVCKNTTPSLWEDLSILKTYFEKNRMSFQVIDYSD